MANKKKPKGDLKIKSIELDIHELRMRLSRMERLIESNNDDKEDRIRLLEAFFENIEMITNDFKGN
jgi:hypothetical protein